jgi:hypothetical protein
MDGAEKKESAVGVARGASGYLAFGFYDRTFVLSQIP